jgi:hypothetical protein
MVYSIYFQLKVDLPVAHQKEKRPTREYSTASTQVEWPSIGQACDFTPDAEVEGWRRHRRHESVNSSSGQWNRKLKIENVVSCLFISFNVEPANFLL